MFDDMRRLVKEESGTLVRESFGLLGVCAAIVVALYLPILG